MLSNPLEKYAPSVVAEVELINRAYQVKHIKGQVEEVQSIGIEALAMAEFNTEMGLEDDAATAFVEHLLFMQRNN